MKGLLIKDIRLLAQQKNILVIFLFYMVIMMLSGIENPSFFLGYIPFLILFYVIGTISYDEYDNGYPFLFTMPISRREYVGSKYVLDILACFLASVLSVGAYGITLCLGKGTVDFTEVCVIAASCLAVCFLVLAVTLPFLLKYGADKARVYIIIAVVAISVGGSFVVNKIQEVSQFDVAMQLGEILNKIGNSGVAAGVFFLVVAAIAVSYSVSVRIMEKKEF